MIYFLFNHLDPNVFVFWIWAL